MDTFTKPVGATSAPALTDFSQYILNWNNAQNHVDTLQEQLRDCEGFDIPQEFISQVNGEFVHVYMGLNENEKLVFLLIDSAKDNKSTILSTPDPLDEEWPIVQVPAKYPDKSKHLNIDTEQLDEPEAMRRIANWDNNYLNWIQEMCRDEKPLFQAWRIHKTDLSSNPANYSARFGLVVKDQSSTPDLVIVCQEQYKDRYDTILHNAYYDLVRPVPPFKFVEMPEFYLLMYALASH